MHPVLAKLKKRLDDKGPRETLRSLVQDVKVRALDVHREIYLMELSLVGNPKALPQATERAKWPFTMEDITDAHYPKLVEMLKASEPWRIDAVLDRQKRGIPGFVAVENGEVVGYFYYEYPDPQRAPHPDFEWLGMTLEPGDVYTFDGYIPVALRGRGTHMFRLAYEKLIERGFTRVRGYVYAWEKAALFTYRVMGWRQVGRMFEHRIAGRWVVVDRVLYKLNRFDRTRLVPLPIPDAIADWVRANREARSQAAKEAEAKARAAPTPGS